MSLIEGIGDEVTQFFIIVCAVVVAYVAWCSTNISEQRQYRTVVLLDRRRHLSRSLTRIRLPNRNLTNHTETVTISEGTSTVHSPTAQSEEESDSGLVVVPDASDNLSEASSSQSSSSSPELSRPDIPANSVKESTDNHPDTNQQLSDLDEIDIIQTMDADTRSEVRQRRLAHFESAPAGVDAPKTTVERPVGPSSSQDEVASTSIDENKSRDGLTIKLKYINDDVRIVDGRLEELLGDFKRRHFTEELSSNKAVKLIFNGQVLKQDRNTLQSCGLFDNCVVHCLIHQKRPSINETDANAQEGLNDNVASQFFRDSPFVRVTNVNNNNQGIDWDLGNFLFALVSVVLLGAWYFRYIYGHLYTVTATVGLIIITGVFSIALLGVYFTDNETQDANLRLRVTRTERIEVQQQ